MKRRRLAIVGFGRLGQACASAILESDDLARPRAMGSREWKRHQRFLLEGRFDHVAIAGQVMAAAARALSLLRAGAYPLNRIPLAALR